ncbi:MAG TPA: nuclear transport factor 2 family protein [Thermoleophilaceae bacterium]|nr:nuclear transport factor 2 family protein [Thermoleophilaceae bacterium]
MSSANVELGRRFLNAWNERDGATLADSTHADAEILLPRNLLEGGSYRGPEGVVRALADATETWEEVYVEVQEMRQAAGGELVALTRTVNTARSGGPRTAYEAAYVMTARDGKVASLRPYLSHREGLEAVGLEP